MNAPTTLQLDLRELERQPRSWTARLPVEAALWADTELVPDGPGVVELQARTTGSRGVHVTGKLEVPVRLACRRCLKPLPRTVEVALDLLYDRGVGEQEADAQVYPLDAEASTLDLTPALREQLLLAVPGYPLCREDCAGLCPKCGVDLNEGSCDCVLTEPDPRWDVLRKLTRGETATG
jgi:uncharacterized protein